MNQAMILSLVRSLLITAGGVAVTKGYVTADTLQQIVGGLVAIGAAVWGALDKRK